MICASLLGVASHLYLNHYGKGGGHPALPVAAISPPSLLDPHGGCRPCDLLYHPCPELDSPLANFCTAKGKKSKGAMCQDCL